MAHGKNLPATTHTLRQRTRPFPPRRDYASLSVHDLMDAREAYHVHLSRLENVIGTAIGRYRIHEKDWYATHPPDVERSPKARRITEPKTLANTVVRPWSWPAVVVFVREWKESRHLGPEAVPRSLYLPDGRVVPTCVLLAPPDTDLPPPVPGPSQVSALLGGGYSCLREHQHAFNVGTLACLVKKDGTYYALTSRHVAGGEGDEVRAFVRGEYHPIGRSSNSFVGRLLVPNVFRGWPGDRTYLTLDAALVRIDDVSDWTSQAFGIGEIGEIFDATEESVTLDLIGCPVRGFGGTSGVMEGEIQALFFRYQSLGGFDEATDLLIGPRKDSVAADPPGVHGSLKKGAASRNRANGGPSEQIPFTRPGDSGTLWFYDPPSAGDPAPASEDGLSQGHLAPERGLRARRLRPLALQWGGERLRLPDGSSHAFALGSFLSSICRALDVEIVRDWSTGHDEYWGKIGHFAVGWKACERLSGALGGLMMKNQKRIGYADEKLAKGSEFRVGREGFVPLSDVPDYVWINSRPQEGIQHFADIDIHDIDGGPSLLQRCVDDPSFISAKRWQAYFKGFAGRGVGPEEGALPFRVWQIWEDMVAYLKARDVARFVAAAGAMAHYVGDASQPLHCSYLHHGVPPMVEIDGRSYPVPRDSDAFKAFKKTPAAKVHGIYEETMLEVDPATALAKVDERLDASAGPATKIQSGHAAARAVVHLMAAAQKRLDPMTIIEADDPGLGPKARAKAFWENAAIRTATIECLADSVRLLTRLWSSAWDVGGGKSLPKTKLTGFGEERLDDIYRHDKKFVPSLSLANMAKSGRFEP
jgi:hypothetical protein